MGGAVTSLDFFERAVGKLTLERDRARDEIRWLRAQNALLSEVAIAASEYRRTASASAQERMYAALDALGQAISPSG